MSTPVKASDPLKVKDRPARWAVALFVVSLIVLLAALLLLMFGPTKGSVL